MSEIVMREWGDPEHTRKQRAKEKAAAGNASGHNLAVLLCDECGRSECRTFSDLAKTGKFTECCEQVMRVLTEDEADAHHAARLTNPEADENDPEEAE